MKLIRHNRIEIPTWAERNIFEAADAIARADFQIRFSRNPSMKLTDMARKEIKDQFTRALEELHALEEKIRNEIKNLPQ